jgi:hypothetical protein
MAVKRRETNYTKLEKASILFFRLAWIGGIVGFFLLLAITVILGVVKAYRPEIGERKVVILCTAFLCIYFIINMSITALIDFLLELIYVRRKKVTKRLGLEQAFLYLGIALFCWWGIYWAIRSLFGYFENG